MKHEHGIFGWLIGCLSLPLVWIISIGIIMVLFEADPEVLSYLVDFLDGAPTELIWYMFE